MATKKLTAAQTKKFKGVLLEERDRLSAIIARHQAELEEARLAEAASDRTDPESGDGGSMKFEMQKELSVDMNTRDLLAKVDIALQRIDDGSYGVCEVCGNPIPRERLEILPHTTLCVNDAAARR